MKHDAPEPEHVVAGRDRGCWLRRTHSPLAVDADLETIMTVLFVSGVHVADAAVAESLLQPPAKRAAPEVGLGVRVAEPERPHVLAARLVLERAKARIKTGELRSILEARDGGRRLGRGASRRRWRRALFGGKAASWLAHGRCLGW
jgi:hypothetical protein